MCSDLAGTSRCCAFYSAVGVLFTLWVGVMLQTQPFFIAGIEDYDQAKSSAYGAMAMFVVTFISSILGLWYDSQNKVDETESTGNNCAPEAEYHLSTGDAPASYGTSS